MNIQPIVEGHGEVEALPLLLRRLGSEGGVYSLGVNSPIRRKRSELVQEGPLRKAVRLALLQQCSGILILFDCDDDCPKTLAPDIARWARSEAGGTPCEVVIPKREYEAWFLATIESLRGKRGIRNDAVSHPSPETPRDAKGQLEERMLPGNSYAPTADQASLTATFDLRLAHERCRSFKRMVRAFGLLASGAGTVLAPWPPPGW